jgi:CBS domain-containing protein
VTLGPEDSLMRGLEVMRLNRIRQVPVLLDGKLIGLLTEGDLKRAEPSTLSESEEDFNRVMDETLISRIMIKDPVRWTRTRGCWTPCALWSATGTAPCPWWPAAGSWAS